MRISIEGRLKVFKSKIIPSEQQREKLQKKKKRRQFGAGTIQGLPLFALLTSISCD